MDRRWEIALNAVAFLLLALGMIGPLFMKPPFHTRPGSLLITVPLLVISAILLAVANRGLTDRQRNVLVVIILVLYMVISFVISGAFSSFNPLNLPVILLVFLIFGGFMGYVLYLRLHISWDPTITIPPEEREIQLERSYDSVYQSCLTAPRVLPFISSLEEDRKKGTFSGEAYTGLIGSMIIISLKRITPEKTAVRVTSHYPGTPQYPDLVREWQKGYVDSICEFLLKPVTAEDLALMAWPHARQE